MVMDFACTLPGQPQIDQASAWVAAVSDSASSWLLLDPALLSPATVRRVTTQYAGRLLNTQAQGKLKGLGAQAPTLLLTDGVSRDDIVRLLRLVGFEHPSAVSWLRSQAASQQLQQLLGTLQFVSHDDTPLYCRVADTRVLPHLLGVLDGTLHACIAHHIDAWHCFDRHGNVTELPLPAKAPVADPPGIPSSPILLNTLQFTRLLDASEADAVFLQLLETVPSMVPDSARGQFHEKLVRLLETAQRLGLTSSTDRRQFVVLGLGSHESFHTLPLLAPTWQRIAAERISLTDAMQDWSNDIWAVLERLRVPVP